MGNWGRRERPLSDATQAKFHPFVYRDDSWLFHRSFVPRCQFNFKKLSRPNTPEEDAATGNPPDSPS